MIFFSWLWQEMLAAYATTFPISTLSNRCLRFSGESKEKAPFSQFLPETFP